MTIFERLSCAIAGNSGMSGAITTRGASAGEKNIEAESRWEGNHYDMFTPFKTMRNEGAAGNFSGGGT